MALTGVENLARLPELKKKLLWTFFLLAIYRFGINVPIPGIDPTALSQIFEKAKDLVGVFDMFSGGGLRKMSICALGIMPYISASIIMQLLTVASPELKRMQREEGAAGRKKITQWTRYGTVLITIVQGAALAYALKPEGALKFGYLFVTVVTLTAGTVFLMWLGEQITEKGLGNGISLIIFAGIVARFPAGVRNTFRNLGSGQMSLFEGLVILAVMAATLGFIVYVERGQRRIPIQYAKRMMGRRMMGGQTTHLPLRVNTAGVIPPIFASSILMFPSTISQFTDIVWLKRISAYFTPASFVYSVVFVALITFFCFFYTAIIFDPKDIAENLKKQGGFIPGIRPGAKTKEYIDKVLTRITLWGALYISVICVMPMMLIRFMKVPFYFGGTGLLIVVGVAMDFMGQIESYLISRQYEGLMQKGKLKGRRS